MTELTDRDLDRYIFGLSTSAAADPPGARASEPPAPDAPRPDAPSPDASRKKSPAKPRKKKGQ